ASGIARLGQTKRLHLRPLGIGQNESFHPKLESQPSSNENLEASVRSAARLSGGVMRTSLKPD
ncbi:MAG: hypothetical protein ACJ8DQ_07765, partial [Xanthobacteraceae bacterium]